MVHGFVFHENFDRRIFLACLLSCHKRSDAVSWTGTPTLDRVIGPLAIAWCMLSWGLDNNLTL